jgi:hypothetical protein
MSSFIIFGSAHHNAFVKTTDAKPHSKENPVMSLFSLPKASWKMLGLLLLVGFHVKLSSQVMKKCKDIFVGNEALVSAWK